MKKQLLKLALSLGCIIGLHQAANAQLSSATLTVKDTTIAPTSVTASPSAFCTGSSSSLSLSGGELGTGRNWRWYESMSTTGTLVGSGPGAISVSPTNTTTAPITKTYYVTAVDTTTGGTACAYTRWDSVTVTINPTPTLVLPANDTICVGSPLAYTVTSPTSGTTITWSGGSTVGINNQTTATAVGSGVITGTAINSGTTFTTATITVTPTANGCTGLDTTFKVTVLPKPIMTASNNAQTDCNGIATDAVAFSSTATGGTVTYAWTRTTSSGTGVAGSGSGTGIASFTATTSSCAQAKDSVKVVPTYTLGSKSCAGDSVWVTYTVNPTPEGTITTNTPICEGETATITFDASCGTQPFNLGINTTAGTAATTANYTGIADLGTFNIVPVPTSGDTTYYLWHITDSNGCVNQATAP